MIFKWIKGFFKSILKSFGQVILIVALLIAVVLLGQQFIGGFFNQVGEGVRDGLVRFSDLFAPQPYDISQIVLPEVEPIQALSALTVTNFNYAGIVTSDTGMPGLLQTLYGDNLVMVAVVRVQAGVDLDLITSDDLTYDQETNTITLQIPAATVQNCFLNDQESYVVSRSTGIFARNAPQLDTSARRFAIRQFRDQAIEMNIISTAQERAEEVTANFIRAFVPEDVTIVIISAPAPDVPVWGDTCG